MPTNWLLLTMRLEPKWVRQSIWTLSAKPSLHWPSITSSCIYIYIYIYNIHAHQSYYTYMSLLQWTTVIKNITTYIVTIVIKFVHFFPPIFSCMVALIWLMIYMPSNQRQLGPLDLYNSGFLSYTIIWGLLRNIGCDL